MASDMTKISGILVVIGGLLCLLYGILNIIGAPFGILPGLGLGGILGGLIIGIIQIILGLVALATSGFVNIPALKLEKNWIILLILGIVMYLFAAGLPGILVIIGAILLLL